MQGVLCDLIWFLLLFRCRMEVTYSVNPIPDARETDGQMVLVMDMEFNQIQHGFYFMLLGICLHLTSMSETLPFAHSHHSLRFWCRF